MSWVAIGAATIAALGGITSSAINSNAAANAADKAAIPQIPNRAGMAGGSMMGPLVDPSQYTAIPAAQGPGPLGGPVGDMNDQQMQQLMAYLMRRR